MDDNRNDACRGGHVWMYIRFHFRSASFRFPSFLPCFSLAGMGSRPWEGYSLSVYAEACTRVFSPTLCLSLNSLLHYLSFGTGQLGNSVRVSNKPRS